MHAKHRNGPGNGYRPNVMGMGGVAAASRIPPEGAMRGHRMYNTEYRNYNRGGYGGGGHSKQFQQPVLPPRGADIFVEAGKLAAEYLVSKGVLPPNALSGKWQNDGLKNVRNFQGFRPHEVEKIQSPADGRAAADSRLGNAALDAGPGRRRYSDDYNSMGSRSSIRGRERTGSFKNYGSDGNRELGRSGSWAEKINASPGMDANSDASVGHRDEQPADKDGKVGIQGSSPGEITQEVDNEAHIESGLEKCNLVEDADANDGTLSNEKHPQSDPDGEHMKKSDDSNNFDNEGEVVKEGRNDDDLQQQNDENKMVTASVRVDGLVSEDHVDLVKHCKFVNVPTKTRSSLTIKGSKGDQDTMNKDENSYKGELVEGSRVHVIDVDVDNSAGNASSHQNHEFKIHQSDVPAVEEEPDVTNTTRPGHCLRSGSFPGRSVYTEPEADEGLSVFGRSNSMFMERGEKRAMDFNTDAKEDVKKLRQWVPAVDAQSDGSPPLSSSMENQPLLQDPRTSLNAHSTLSPDQRSLDISLFPKDHADSCEFIQEKQLFPGSFKTCDLNLVGNGDVSENHDAGRMLVFPSVMQTGKVATPIDVDLSISNNGSLPNKNGKHGINANEIEVIDLEKDSAQEDKTLSNPERRGDTVFTDLDGFPNTVHNANGIPDVQDGYGLMISELLGNDSPNCSSVPGDLNSLHNHMGLPNTEGILGDDDSIYMSLGEIPISLLGAWEQPSQDYGKPF